jgi:UDP-N-acetylglucosamine:LPS N-acetylglucosamine transferase
MVILSGPEPQRTFLEEKLIKEIQSFDGKILFIKGIIESEQKIVQDNNVTYYNFMTSSEIETAFNESKIVLCRSGYTTVMDLAKLQKKAFFIPTPGQFEQEHLARRLKRNVFLPYAKQDDFKIENLSEISLYGGLPHLLNEIDWKQLFVLFERE